MGGLKLLWSCVWQIVFLLPVLYFPVVRPATDTCGELPTIQNAEPIENVRGPYPIGTNITLRCKSGYNKEFGTTEIARCQLTNNVGSWVMPSLTCIPVNCGDPGTTENGQRTGYVFTFGNSVNYTCNRGYEIVGPKSLYCMPSGSWTRSPPKCKQIVCPQPRDIDNGSVTVSSLNYGAKAVYSCKKGFKLNGTKERQCSDNKTWSEEEPKCQEVRCIVPKDQPGVHIIFTAGNRDLGASPNTLMIYTCSNDNTRVSVVCLDTGEWSRTLPKCSGAGNVTDMSLFTNATTYTTTTPLPLPGSTNFTGVVVITTPPPPVGKKGCKLDKDFLNGNYNGTALPDGMFPTHTRLKFNCNSGFKLDSVDGIIICEESGKWNRQVPKCSKRFPTMLVVIVSLGVVLFFVTVCGVFLWWRNRRQRLKRERDYLGTTSKARLSDARDYEEMKYLGKDRPEKPIPVTVL